MKGGTKRLKQCNAGIGRKVSTCVLATDEDMHIYKENLEGIKMKKVNKWKTDYELYEGVLISVDRETINPILISEHRPCVNGPLNSGWWKWKHTTINEGEKWRREVEIADA